MKPLKREAFFVAKGTFFLLNCLYQADILKLLGVLKMEEHDNEQEDVVIKRNELEMNKTRHLCLWKKHPIDLTITEFLMLYALVEKTGIVKTRDQLINSAYGPNVYIDDRTVDSHIKRLRKKFKDVDKDFSCIETLYGIGYRYREG